MDRFCKLLKPVMPVVMGLTAVSAAWVTASDAHGQTSPSEIAERFAGADREDADAAARETQVRDEKIRAEARKAVERALAKQSEEARDTGEPALSADSASEASSTEKVVDASPAPELTEPAPSEPAASASEPTTPAPSTIDTGSADDDAKALGERLRNVRREKAIEAQRPRTSEEATPAVEDKGLVSQVVSKFATQAAEYISPLVEKRVTVMLVMEVGKTGVRRWSKTADPMLCIHENCYLSRGADKPAEKLTRDQAFGPSVAVVKRGGACRSQPACIFRDIDLETVEAKLQPIDLKFLRHDRRDAQPIRADTTCAIIDAKLSCRAPVEGKSWKAWVVPESVAKQAGAEGLALALKKGIE
ncbi:MAG: hypothetical protein RIC14_02040 [Filomicrobium sp.]